MVDISEKYLVLVDYSLSLKEMLSPIAKYGLIHVQISEKNFPIHGSGKQKVELELIKLSNKSSTEEILQEMLSRKLRPATLPELLAFGTQFPNKVMKYSIFALGSVWNSADGHSYIPGLSISMWGREVSAYRTPENDKKKWPRIWSRYLAVRE